MVLVPRIRTATGSLYPNNLVCSEAADEAIGGALFVDGFLIALPLTIPTELVAGKLEASEFADDIKATLRKCSAVWVGPCAASPKIFCRESDILSYSIKLEVAVILGLSNESRRESWSHVSPLLTLVSRIKIYWWIQASAEKTPGRIEEIEHARLQISQVRMLAQQRKCLAGCLI